MGMALIWGKQQARSRKVDKRSNREIRGQRMPKCPAEADSG